MFFTFPTEKENLEIYGILEKTVSIRDFILKGEFLYYLCRVLDASTPSYQNAAVSTYFHSLKGVSSGTKETSNEIVLK